LEVSGKLHALAALPSGKEPQVPIGYEVGWTPEAVWTIWRRENSLPYRDSNSDPLVVQPVASRYTDYATPAHVVEMDLAIIYIKLILNPAAFLAKLKSNEVEPWYVHYRSITANNRMRN
jgi:hypothetical protein